MAVHRVLAGDDFDLGRFLPNAPYQFWLFAGLAVASEIVPFVASRFQRLRLPVFMSVCFSFAVLLVWGIGPAVLVQTAAMLGAWFRLRLTAVRVAAIGIRLDVSLLVAGLAFDAVVDRHFTPGGQIPGIGLSAVVAAVAAWFVANYVLLIASARFRLGGSWRQGLRPVVPYDVLSNAALLMLAPSLVSGPGWVIVLLLVPLAVVGQMARLSGEEDRQARADPVTGLLSRRAILSDITKLRIDRRGRRGGGPSYALFMLDLNRFKNVNDSLGHDVGDRLLAEVGRRLTAAVRPGDLVSRLGGDEFVVVAIGVSDRSEAAALGERIERTLSEPIVQRELPIEVGHSMGVALYPDDGDDLTTVMRHADSAMYAAKQRGGGLAFYAGEPEEKPREGLSLLADLRRALDDSRTGNEMALRYQPKVSLDDGRVRAVEALVDWQRPGHGGVDPDEVFRVAEYTPVMRRLTTWMVNEALDQLVTWRAEGRHFRLSVRISPRDLETTELLEVIADRLRRDGIGPRLLVFEIDENALSTDPDRFAQAFGLMAEAGVDICLQSFGTGRSSIQNLRRPPVSELKIDAALVGRMTSDRDSDAVVRAIIEMGRVLEVRVVATGVANEATHRLLADYGCPLGQGPCYAEPMAAGRLRAWLDNPGRDG